MPVETELERLARLLRAGAISADDLPMDEATQAQRAREVAALRMQQAARPDGGRQEGGMTDALSDPALLFNMSPLGMARDTMQAVNEGDYGRAAMSAAPLAALGAGPVVRGVGSVMQSFPKSSALGAGLAAMLSSAEAGPKLTDRQQQRLEMQKQGAANQLEADRQRKELEMEAQRQQFEMDQQRRNDADAYAQRQREIAEQQRQAELRAQQEEAERQAQMPFRERYPNVAAALPAAGVAASALLPYSVRLGKALYSNRGVGQMNDAVARAEASLLGGDKSQMARSAAELKSHMKNVPASSEGPISAGPLALGISAGLPVEAALLPAEYDAMTLPPGANRDAARALLMNPEELAKRAVPGFLQGITAGSFANKIPAAWPERLAPTANAEGLIAGLKAANARKRKPTQAKAVEQE